MCVWVVPRWKHLLLLGAVLSADQERRRLPRLTRTSLEEAFCRAVNMSLEEGAEGDDRKTPGGFWGETGD